MFIAIVAILFLSIVYNALPENIQEKIRNWVKDTSKWAAVCGVAVGILFAMFIFLPDVLAEDLSDGFYYKVVFVDEVEELEEELLLHGNDADRLWDWYEDYPEEDEEFFYYEFNKELSNLALCWAQENGFFVQLDKEDRIIKDRIVVLTMRYSDDPLGDEAIDSYFTEFITR